MSDQLLNEVFDLRHSTPGRRAFALKEVEDRGRVSDDDRVDEALLEAIGEAIEDNDEARTKRNWWRRDREVNERSRQKANAIDNELDRTVGALHDTFKATRKGFPDEPRGQAAAEILEALFPDGASGITTLAFEDELSAVRFVVDQLGNNWSEEVDQIGAGPMVDRLSSLADRFADALSDAETRETTWDEVRAADHAGQTAMLRVVAEILGRFNGPDDSQTARRLLGPILEQDERIGELHSRNRRVTDVDPETGEPDDETETPDDETPDDG